MLALETYPSCTGMLWPQQCEAACHMVKVTDALTKHYKANLELPWWAPLPSVHSPAWTYASLEDQCPPSAGREARQGTFCMTISRLCTALISWPQSVSIVKPNSKSATTMFQCVLQTNCKLSSHTVNDRENIVKHGLTLMKLDSAATISQQKDKRPVLLLLLQLLLQLLISSFV